MPLVSVIVTTYNRKEYLSETIQSILCQTFQDFELLVVDNFSNYDFIAFIESFNSEKIIPFQNHNNGIIAVNRNIGIKHATGDFLTFCDDDDLWHRSKLELQLTYMNSRPSAILISTLARKFGKSTDFFSENYGIMYRNIKLDINDILTSNPFVLSSVMIRKEFVLQSKGFSESKELIAIEDLDLYLKIYEKGEFCIIRKILVYYRLHEKNNNSDINRNERLNIFLKSKNIDLQNNKLKKIHFPLLIILCKNSLHLLLFIWYYIIGIICNNSRLNLFLLKSNKKIA